MTEQHGKGLGSALRGVLQGMDHGGRFARSRVTAVWPHVAGEVVADHTTGAYLRDDGALIVYVDTPTWASELTAMSEQFRTALNNELGEELVSSMRFTVSRRVQKGREDRAEEEALDSAYRPDAVAPVPLSPDELQAVAQSVAVIENPQLREAALRATVRDLEWKKALAARNEPQGPPERSEGP